MRRPAWLWVGIALDLILSLPGFYMAIAAVDVVGRSDRSPQSVGVAVLFFALPVICLAAPLAALRAHKNRLNPRHIAVVLIAPAVYAAFLVIFILA